MLVTSCVLVISYLQARTNKPKFKTITEVSLKGFLQREHKLEYKQFHFMLFHSENFNWRMQLAFIHMQMKTNFHMKRWAPRLALKEVKGNSEMAY